MGGFEAHREERDEADRQEVVHLFFKKETIMVSWAGFTDDGSLPFLLIYPSPPPFPFVFLLILSTPLYLLHLSPSIYPINHAVVPGICNADISYTKSLIFIPGLPDCRFPPAPVKSVTICTRKIENPCTSLS